MFTASDLADWFDEGVDKYWKQQDDFLIESAQLGDAHPVIVFGEWLGDRIRTGPQRILHGLAGGVVDVLRLGCDLELDSAWGIIKGSVLNVLRLAAVVAPASEALSVGSRYAGRDRDAAYLAPPSAASVATSNSLYRSMQNRSGAAS